MASILVKHMLTDYEKWKVAFHLLASGNYGIRILSFSTEMDKSNPEILLTQIQLSEKERPVDNKLVESVTLLFDELGLRKRYEIT